MDFDVPEQHFNLPEQNVKLMDNTSLLASLDVIYPLYTGGYISALKQQAKKGIEIDHEETIY